MQLLKFFELGQNSKQNLTPTKPKPEIGAIQDLSNSSNTKENVGNLKIFNKNTVIQNKLVNKLEVTNGNTDILNSEIKGDAEILNGTTNIHNSNIGDIEITNGMSNIHNSNIGGIDSHNQSFLIRDSNVNGDLANSNNGNKNIIFDETLKTNANTAIIHSNVYGDIENTNGIIGIADSNIYKNIDAANGTLIIQNSNVKGNVNVQNGNLKIQNSSIKKVTIPTNCLSLEGANTIENLEFTKSVEISKPDDIKTLTGRVLTNPKLNIETKTPINCFTLTSGTSLKSTITFFKYPGTLIVDEGAEFIGSIINGSVVRKGLKSLL